MTTLPTPAELRELANEVAQATSYHSQDVAARSDGADALRQFATLIEDAEKGVTDEVVDTATTVYDAKRTEGYGKCSMAGLHQALLAVAPHLALTHSQTHSLTKDKP